MAGGWVKFSGMDLNNMLPTIPVRYFLRIPNFGDLLNPLIVGAVSGRDPRWSAREDCLHLLAIGSLMAGATPQSYVWGTGVMHPAFGTGAVDGQKVYALRGPQSFSALREAGVSLRDVPFGDPAMLAPRLFGIRASSAPRHALGVVAHYVDRQRPAIRHLLAQDGVADLNVHGDPLDLMRTMADCEVVVSSSLHGLIVAEALGLPSLWIKAGEDIAGDDFKFGDWFATTRNRQQAPHILMEGERMETLIAMAEQRDHMIDLDALSAAFPIAEGLCEEPSVPRKPVSECRRASVPIFLISFNRGPMLRHVIAGLRELTTPVAIIVHDNGSSDPQTLDILSELEQEGVVVYRYGPIGHADELNQVNERVSRYFADWNEPCPYVVSDCDVDIAVAERDVLQVYASLLNRFRRVACVGPMLRIRDIPLNYPLRNRVLNRHIDQFWKHEPIFAEQDGRSFAYQEALIDTTFAMHRAGEPFRRLKSGVRVYEPFEALHLDWYLGEASGGGERVYAETSHPGISHWNNVAETRQHEACMLEFSEFRYVAVDTNDQLQVETGLLEGIIR
jgi:hypothetical protein